MFWILAIFVGFALAFMKLGALAVWLGILTAALEVAGAVIVGLLVVVGLKSRKSKV